MYEPRKMETAITGWATQFPASKSQLYLIWKQLESKISKSDDRQATLSHTQGTLPEINMPQLFGYRQGNLCLDWQMIAKTPFYLNIT
jgi:hypothetical protein